MRCQNIIRYIVITIDYLFGGDIFMLSIFTAAMMAIGMFLSGAGIDRLNNQKAKNQQAQHAQITCAPESAGTSNEPEQATEQNDEPSLAANCHNELA